MHWYHAAALDLALRTPERLTVLDRWWPSEQIYAWAYRGGSPWEHMGRILDRWGLRHGVTYCITERENKYVQMRVHAQLARTRGEMYKPDERIGKLHDGYSALHGMHSFRPDWSRWCLDETGVDLMERAEKLVALAYTNALEASLSPIAESSGTFRGRYFFVGERANPRQHRYLGPWVGFTGASWTMAHGLAGFIDEGECYWTNIKTWKGDDEAHQKQVSAFIETYQGRTVALGDEAAKWLGTRCRYKLPHPAYVARFQGVGTMARYIQRIR